MQSRKVVRAATDESVSGWYAILPEPKPARTLDENITVDWVIVGGGFAGLSAAQRLKKMRSGDRIVLLDAQRIGWGAAGRNSGFMIDLPHEIKSESYAGGLDADRKTIAQNRAGIEIMRETVEEYGLQEWFNPCGKHHGATNGNGLKALTSFEQHLDKLGEPYTHLSADDLKEITGTSYYAGGTHTPGAVIIQPAALVRGIAEGLSDKVEIYENTPVVEIVPGENPEVVTPNGRVSAKNLILTVNGHVESFGYVSKRLVHLFLYGSMTRQLTTAEQEALGGHEDWALIPADPMGSTVRRLKEGRIVVRNSATYNPDMSSSAKQVENAGRNNDKSFRARFPMLPDVDMEHRWGGHLCLSLNSVPVFGEIDKNVYAACCQNGLGSVKGTLNGKLTVDLALGADDTMVADMLAHEQPQRIYPEPFMTIGVNARLWWIKKRAGTDF